MKLTILTAVRSSLLLVVLAGIFLLVRQPSRTTDRPTLPAFKEHDETAREPYAAIDGEGDDAASRLAYEQMRLRDPATLRIPKNVRQRELAFARLLPRRDDIMAKTGATPFAEDWTLRGPMNVGGRTRALAVDLGYDGASNRRILAGGASGGVFLSEDGGASWSLTSDISTFTSVTCIAQDPSNRNVWYHGTGELFGSAGSVGAEFLGQGLFKSNDGGRTWNQLPTFAQANDLQTFDDPLDFVWNVKVHPQTGDVFVAALGGIFRSQDGGNTWEWVLRGATQEGNISLTTDVAIASDGTLYATIGRGGVNLQAFGVFRSTDGGTTWTPVSPPGLVGDPYRMVIDVAPSAPNVVYLLVQATPKGDNASEHQFFRFDANTGTWTDLSAQLPDPPDSFDNSIGSFKSQQGYDLLVRVKMDDPSVVWIGGTNLYRSEDGGSTWDWVGGYHPTEFRYPNHHPDQHALALFPNAPNTILSGHDGGLSKTTNALENNQSWTSLNNGYLTTQFYAVAMDPEAGSDLIMGGTQDNGTWGTFETDASKPWIELLGGDGAFTAVAPGGLTYYVSSQLGNIQRQHYDGNQWTYANVSPAGAENFLFITPFTLDPNDARVMYVAAGNEVWRNSNLDDIPAGNSAPTNVNWTALTASAIQGGAATQVTTLSTAHVPANRLYFGGIDYEAPRTVIKRVDNAGANAGGTDITPPVPAGAYPSSIAINPNDGDEVVATFSNYNIESIWHSTNGGASWTNVGGNVGGAAGPSIRWAAIVPSGNGTVYLLATSTGVYSTTALNGGQTTWVQEAASTIGNVVVDMIIARPEDGVVVAGTHGRGVYSARVDASNAGTAVASVDEQELSIEVQPDASASTSFTLRNDGTAPLQYQIGGSLTDGKRDATLAAATHAITSGLPVLTSAPPPYLRALHAPWGRQTGPAAAVGAVSKTQGDVELVLDDGDDTQDDWFGFGVYSQYDFYWMNLFQLSGGDFDLDGVKFFMRSENVATNNSYVGIVRYDGNQLQLLTEQSLTLETAPQGRWFSMSLDEPQHFSDGETFGIMVGASAGILYPAGIDLNAQVPGYSYYYDPTVDFWYNVNTIGGDENAAFLVRALGTVSAGPNQPPIASGSISTSQPEVGETVTFDASASSDPDGQIVAYEWRFGDGNLSNDAVATHAYAQKGTYDVTLTVTDDRGGTGQATGQLTVVDAAAENQPPTAVAQVTPANAQVGDAVTFDASASNDADGQIVGYAWQFGDGATGTGKTTTHTFGNASTYTFTLTVTDDDGATGQTSGQLVVSSAPNPSRFTLSPATGQIQPGASRTIDVTFDATALDQGIYHGQITVTGTGGQVSLPITVYVGTNVGTEPEPAVPTTFVLDQNYPNPFNPATTIRYDIADRGEVSLAVYDVRGRRLRVLDTGTKAAGTYTVRWDGRDAAGLTVASGVYLYRLTVTHPDGSTERQAKTMILAK